MDVGTTSVTLKAGEQLKLTGSPNRPDYGITPTWKWSKSSQIIATSQTLTVNSLRVGEVLEMNELK